MTSVALEQIIPHGGGRMRGSGPFCLSPRKKVSIIGVVADRGHSCACAVTPGPVSHMVGRAAPVAVTAHMPGSQLGHCVIACLHLTAIPKEQTGSGFGFFTSLGNHRSLLPSATGAHASDHVWVVTFLL